MEKDKDTQKEPEFKSSLILQYWDRSLDKLLAWRSAQAMVFGQPLVFDLSYEGHMSKREVENTVSQLIEVEAWNRRATDPSIYTFVTAAGQLYKQQLLKQQLVYLTADSPNVLRTYDHSKVYIVGAMVDRSIQRGASLANAKRLKLATARLPLDEFLHWETGAKNLTLDQLIRILLTIKETGKWEEALKFVPTRNMTVFISPAERD
ncbi:hypothetical protein WMY93_013488 [Mugilogobius chulae]|uniref:tRNA methyltransferase 10 homolog C n=1 Tax=Mugilogobius chulae TaxID=88201 RepID=A0AAW0P9A7_9GOBI